MSGLRQTAKVSQNLGVLHITTGLITVNSGTWTLVTNDPTCTLTDIGAGNVSVAYEAFLAAPAASAQYIKATTSATLQHSVTIEDLTTIRCEFRVLLSSTEAAAGTNPDPADDDGFSFMIVGIRNN